MAMLRTCSHPGCPILTIGPWCVEHDPPREVRLSAVGRPFPVRRQAAMRRVAAVERRAR